MIKSKQIKDLPVRAFETDAAADAWLSANAETTLNENTTVFRGLRYVNKETGVTYEATWSIGGGSWVWVPVEGGGANIFVTETARNLVTGLGEPTTETTHSITGRSTVDELKVNSEEEVLVKFEWDQGRDYEGDFKFYLFDSQGNLASMQTITLTSANTSELERRYFEADGINNSPNILLDTTGADSFRIYGNGGVSDEVLIQRAAEVAPATAAEFKTIENRMATTGLTTTDHTHLRPSQTFEMDVTFDMSSFSLNDNVPTSIELSGTGVSGTHTYNLTGGDTTAGQAALGSGPFTVTITGIPAGSAVNDNADVVIKAINVDTVEATRTALGSGVPGANEFAFTATQAGDFIGQVGVPMDSVSIDVGITSIAYPFFLQTGFTGVGQTAFKFDDTQRGTPTDRPSVGWTLNQSLTPGTDDITVSGSNGMTFTDDANASWAFATTSSPGNVYISSVTPSTVNLNANVTIVASKAKNDSQDTRVQSSIDIIDVAPTISGSSPNNFRTSGTQTITFSHRMWHAYVTANITSNSTTVHTAGTATAVANQLNGIQDSTTGGVPLTVNDDVSRTTFNYNISGFNAAGYDVAAPIAESFDVNGFNILEYDNAGSPFSSYSAPTGTGNEFNVENQGSSVWRIQLPGNITVVNGGTNAGPGSSLTAGNVTVTTSFDLSNLDTTAGAANEIQFTASAGLNSAIIAELATGLTVEETT